MQYDRSNAFLAEVESAGPDMTKELNVDLDALAAQFPSVRPDILARVVAHELAPNELAKLQDAKNSKDLAQTATALEALLPLLRVYFGILSNSKDAAGAGDDVNVHFLAYVGQLAEFAKEHRWSAVLDYHVAFHGKRLVGMKSGGGEGAFAAWAVVDGELWAKHLQGKKNLKNASASTLSWSTWFWLAIIVGLLFFGLCVAFAFTSAVGSRVLDLEKGVSDLKKEFSTILRLCGRLVDELNASKSNLRQLKADFGLHEKMHLDWLKEQY